MNYEKLAREAENECRWWEARRLWLLVGGGDNYAREYYKSQADACKTIAEAVDLGNRYRELVGDTYQRWENREINNRELYEILRLAHQQVYENK